MTSFPSALTAAVFAAGLSAALAAQPPLTYDACLRMVEREPEAAVEAARDWLRETGAARARHCLALGYSAQGVHDRAAETLQELAMRADAGDFRERAEILAQAGNAWLLAEDAGRALGALDAALALYPSAPEILIDRAQVSILLEDWSVAAQDLDAALRLRPSAPHGLLLRARVYQAQGDAARARALAERVLRLDPDSVEAVVLLGELRQASGGEFDDDTP